MTIRPLDPSHLAEFIQYCRTYGREIDESYINAEDLSPEAFHPGLEEPAYLLLSPAGELIGAASLMLRDYISGRTARLRIFHTRGHNSLGYRLLLQALLPHCAGLDSIYLFVPEGLSAARRAYEEAGFTIMRYSWVLQKDGIAPAEVEFSPGYYLRPFQPGVDEAAWCQVRNAAFSSLQGQVELTPEQVARYILRSDYIPAGMLMLFNGNQPVGVVQAAQDLDMQGIPSAWIYGLAVLPEYQGRGLGRRLLRAAISAGARRGLPSACLSVNAENETAAVLYFQEGFHKVQSMVCYQYQLR